MRSYAAAVFAAFLFWLCIDPAAAEPLSADQLLAQGETQAENKQFDDALHTLDQAAKIEADNLEVKIAVARVHAWQGRYAEAEDEVTSLMEKYPDNTDLRSLDAYIDYYQGRNQAAAKKFARILAVYPAYTDASDGLKLAEQGQDSDAGFPWQLDAGYEHSSFSRQRQPNWGNEFVQVTRLFDNQATAVHARFEYYDEFQTTDTYYEIGVDHRFAPYLDGYLYGGHTVDASFHPTWRTQTGGDLRLAEEKSLSAVWLTLDAKQDEYGPVSILTFNPGARFEFDDWTLSSNLVMVHQWGLPSIFGWNARLDGPEWQGVRLYGGYSDAPETENAITVYTASIYGGAMYDIDDAHTVRLGYTHDDRQNSYIRHVIDVSLTLRL